MKGFIKAVIDLYIYSSIHVAIVATLFCAETFFFICHEIDLVYLGIVFFSTLFMYSLHRIIGITKVSEDLILGRYQVIHKHKSDLKVYAAISLLGLIFCFVFSTLSYLVFLIPLGIISLLYAVPFFSDQKRLRDINFIKIFLIAIVWSALSIAPIASSGTDIHYGILCIVAIERLIYIIGITIPFDVRDLKIDQSLVTKTIPQYIGVRKSYFLSYTLTLISFILYISLAVFSNQYNLLGYITIAFILSLGAIFLSRGKESDYYYSGLLDGVIGIRALIIIIGSLGSI